MAAPRWVRLALMAVTLVIMAWQCLPNVPREYVDFGRVSGLRGIAQEPSFGTDTIADVYEAKVILNDPRDMYTKAKLAQTTVEADTWSKAASAPYPPVVLLTETWLYAMGQRVGIGLYGMILILGGVFILGSAWYFVQTRWYVFPLLYLNFSYFAHRFVAVQDASYLVMLVVILAALVLARYARNGCHALMAIAITMKLLPLFYVTEGLRMSRRAAALCISILLVGLVLPYFVWDNYSYIYFFHDEVKGGRGGLVAGLGIGALFSLLLMYVSARRHFDLETRLGWALIPCAMFLAMKMNVPRHLLIVLLVPDKHAIRNLIAAFALLIPALFPESVRFGATLPIATVLLFAVLGWHLRQIGWATVRGDSRRPGDTLRMMFT